MPFERENPPVPHAHGPPGALVVIPTYNEVENLESIVDRTLGSDSRVEVLVVDDNSPDGTGELADALARRHDEVHVLHRAGKEGLGAAYLAAFDWALEHDYPAVVEMDADGSHRPEQLPRIMDALEDADVVLGSRWVPGGSVENWPMSREVLSRLGNAYVRMALGLGVRDATGGFRAFRSRALRELELDTVESQGYCFQVDLARRAVAMDHRVVEVPIDFAERERGDSKMSGAIVGEALWRVTAWAAQERLPGRRASRSRAA